jgi:hypothetical protein
MILGVLVKHRKFWTLKEIEPDKISLKEECKNIE